MTTTADQAETDNGKPLYWMGSSKGDLSSFPLDVKAAVGFALRVAQQGGRSAKAKPLRGQGGAGVLEIVSNDNGNTYRAVYTVKLEKAVYVLHAFQKKSKTGIATPQPDLDLIASRLKLAEAHHKIL